MCDQGIVRGAALGLKDTLDRVGIQRVCADLNLSPGQVKQITDVHSRRNEAVYRAPLPPVSQAEADAMLAIVNMATVEVVALTSPG